MGHTTPLTASRYPDASDSPNIAQYIQNLGLDLEDNTIPRFATTTARDTAYAAYTSAGGVLEEGLTCYTRDAGYWEYNNGAWQSMHGLLGHGITTTNTTATAAAVSFPTGMRFSCYLQTGRAYEYSTAMRAWSTVANDVALINVRITTGTPASTDPGVAAATVSLPVAGGAAMMPLSIQRVFQVATPGTYSFTIWGNRSGGTGTITFNIMPDVTLAHQVKDVGIALSSVPFPV